MAKGTRRAAFRARIEVRLAELGYSEARYVWQTAPAGLMVIIDDAMRIFPIHAGQAHARVEYEMGRLAGWSEAMRMRPIEAPARIVRRRPKATVGPEIVHMEELIAAAIRKPNGVDHGTHA